MSGFTPPDEWATLRIPGAPTDPKLLEEYWDSINADWRLGLVLGDLGDIVVLRADNGWHRACRIVGITDVAPHQREYRLREVTVGGDHGDEVFQPEDAEERDCSLGLQRAQDAVEEQGRVFPEVEDDHRQQVGGPGHGFEEHRQDQSRPGGEDRREAAQRQGFDGGDLNAPWEHDKPGGRQVGELQGQISPRPEGPVLTIAEIAARLEGHRALTPIASQELVQHLVRSVLEEARPEPLRGPTADLIASMRGGFTRRVEPGPDRVAAVPTASVRSRRRGQGA